MQVANKAQLFKIKDFAGGVSPMDTIPTTTPPPIMPMPTPPPPTPGITNPSIPTNPTPAPVPPAPTPSPTPTPSPSPSPIPIPNPIQSNIINQMASPTPTNQGSLGQLVNGQMPPPPPPPMPVYQGQLNSPPSINAYGSPTSAPITSPGGIPSAPIPPGIAGNLQTTQPGGNNPGGLPLNPQIPMTPDAGKVMYPIYKPPIPSPKEPLGDPTGPWGKYAPPGNLTPAQQDKIGQWWDWLRTINQGSGGGAGIVSNPLPPGLTNPKNAGAVNVMGQLQNQGTPQFQNKAYSSFFGFPSLPTALPLTDLTQRSVPGINKPGGLPQNPQIPTGPVPNYPPKYEGLPIIIGKKADGTPQYGWPGTNTPVGGDWSKILPKDPNPIFVPPVIPSKNIPVF